MGDVFRIHSFAYDTIVNDSLELRGISKIKSFPLANSNTVLTIETSDGPFGENAVKFVPSIGSGSVYHGFSVPNSSAYFSLGCWVRFDALSVNDKIMDITLSGSSNIFTLGTHSTDASRLVLKYINETFMVPEPSTDIIQGTWFHVQIDLYTAASGSYMKMRINGADDVELTSGFNPGAGTSFAGVRLGPSSAGAQYSIANLWAAHGGFKGVCLARPLLPTSDASVELNSTGDDNYTEVDDTTLDEGTYVSETTTNFPVTDLYGCEQQADVPTQMIAFGVDVVGVKTDVDDAIVRAAVKYATEAVDLSTDSLALGASTVGTQFVWNEHPDGVSGAISDLTGANAADMINGSVFGVNLATTI